MTLPRAFTYSPLFKGVPTPTLSSLARAATRQRIRKNARIFDESEDIDRLWLVEEGLVQLAVSLSSGRQVTLDLAHPGDVFGWVSARTGRTFAGAVALTPSTLVSLPRDLFERLRATAPKLCRNTEQVLATRLCNAYTLRALQGEPSGRRLRGVLDWLFRRMGPSIPLTRSAIADLAGTSWETAVRVLSPLERAGVIRSRRGVIEVLRPERLLPPNSEPPAA